MCRKYIPAFARRLPKILLPSEKAGPAKSFISPGLHRARGRDTDHHRPAWQADWRPRYS